MVGKVTTQGDRAIKANLARELFGINGKGIKIGIISDSFGADKSGVAADIASGDLPGAGNPDGFTKPVQILQDYRGGDDEGRAMAQIIFDVAPGAALLFDSPVDKTGQLTEATFAASVNALAAAGADVIVDDLGTPTPLFQDGNLVQTVNNVVSQGIVYVSAAGNDDSRSYESQFRPSTTFSFHGSTYQAQDFDPGAGIDLFQDIQIPAGSQISLLLNWDQPAGGATADLEMFLLDSPQLPGAGGSTILSQSTIVPSEPNDPSSQLYYAAPKNQTAYLLIAEKQDSASPAPSLVKWISTADGADGNVSYQYVNDASSATGSSTIYGQPNAAGAIAVGAAAYDQTPAYKVNPPILEDFSSEGGSPVLFDAQGNRLATPEIRQKPNIIGPDAVSTTLSDFTPFTGTSAAAPHVAAVVALMLQRAGGRRSLTPAQILAAMQNDAIPAVTSSSSSSKAGLLQANSAVLQSYRSQITGTASAEVIHGSEVADNMLGLDGNDSITGGRGFDAIFGDAGKDSLWGNAGNDYLVGGTGADTLIGGKGSDVLVGNAGNDLLAGDKGSNALKGGAGRDTFVLNRVGLAIVQDFQQGQDKIGLSNQLQFNQLKIVQQQRETVIKFGDRELAVLNKFNALLTASDFRSVRMV